MKTEINAYQDIVNFAEQIINEGVSMHPDDNFYDVVELKTGRKIYTDTEAELRNNLLEKSHSICEKEGIDVYELFNSILKNRIGLVA